MRIANIFNLGIKELRSLGRDPIMLALIGFSFTASVYMAATAMPETLNKAPIAIVDEDQSALSTRIAGAFYPPYFSPPVFITAQEMDSRMDAGLTTFALDIPPNFQRDVLAGRKPDVQLNVDATRMTQAFTGGGYIQTIVAMEVAAFVQRYRAATVLPVDLALRARFNPTLSKAWFGAVIRVIDEITMLSIILTGAALIREREHGTIEHLLVMPVTPFEVMVAKVWAMALVVLAAAAFHCCSSYRACWLFRSKARSPCSWPARQSICSPRRRSASLSPPWRARCRNSPCWSFSPSCRCRCSRAA